MKNTQKTNKKSPFAYKDFLHMLKQTNPPYLLFAIGLLLSISTTVVGLAVPKLTQNMIDGYNLSTLSTEMIVLVGLALIAQALISAISLYLLNRVGQTVIARLRDFIWKKVVHLPLSYFDKKNSGDTISRITNDTSIVKELITERLPEAISGIISVIGAIVILFTMNWRMTMLVLIAIPLLGAFFAIIGKKVQRISKQTQDEMAHLTGHLNQIVPEMRLVKSSNGETLAYDEGKNRINKLLQLGIAESKLRAIIQPMVSLIVMLVLVLIVGYGGYLVSSGIMSSGALVAFVLYLVQVIAPAASISNFFVNLKKSIGATERIQLILSEQEEVLNVGQTLKHTTGDIIIDGVSFGFEKQAVLKNIHAVMPLGQVTAIVGPSGGGKSTLFRLLERFYIQNEGNILLDEKNIQDYTLHSWRKNIGYVAQDSPLVAGTIRENLLFGLDANVTEEAIIDAIKMANAHDFIMRFEKGLESEVGERGVMLSGGQRQRIAIARALLRDPAILMLDEATASLDSESEIAVQEALNSLMKGRTTLVIAHRLSTVVGADQILFLENGQITGRGTHQSLMDSHPLYRQFAIHQLNLPSEVRKAM